MTTRECPPMELAQKCHDWLDEMGLVSSPILMAVFVEDCIKEDCTSAKVLSFPNTDWATYRLAVDTCIHVHDYLKKQYVPHFPSPPTTIDFSNWDARSIVLEALRKVLDTQEAL